MRASPQRRAGHCRGRAGGRRAGGGLASLHAAPHGVRRRSLAVPGWSRRPTTSAWVDLRPPAGEAQLHGALAGGQRQWALADGIASFLFALSGSQVDISGHYPGWRPDPSSPLLALAQQVFRREFGAESTMQVIHAGLECGLIAAPCRASTSRLVWPHHPRRPRAGERVEIESVGKAWRLLAAILAETLPPSHRDHQPSPPHLPAGLRTLAACTAAPSPLVPQLREALPPGLHRCRRGRAQAPPHHLVHQDRCRECDRSAARAPWPSCRPGRAVHLRQDPGRHRLAGRRTDVILQLVFHPTGARRRQLQRRSAACADAEPLS